MGGKKYYLFVGRRETFHQDGKSIDVKSLTWRGLSSVVYTWHEGTTSSLLT